MASDLYPTGFSLDRELSHESRVAARHHARELGSRLMCVYHIRVADVEFDSRLRYIISRMSTRCINNEYTERLYLTKENWIYIHKSLQSVIYPLAPLVYSKYFRKTRDSLTPSFE